LNALPLRMEKIVVFKILNFFEFCYFSQFTRLSDVDASKLLCLVSMFKNFFYIFGTDGEAK
jgi:hypothetical protein